MQINGIGRMQIKKTELDEWFCDACRDDRGFAKENSLQEVDLDNIRKFYGCHGWGEGNTKKCEYCLCEKCFLRGGKAKRTNYKPFEWEHRVDPAFKLINKQSKRRRKTVKRRPTKIDSWPLQAYNRQQLYEMDKKDMKQLKEDWSRAIEKQFPNRYKKIEDMEIMSMQLL